MVSMAFVWIHVCFYGGLWGCIKKWINDQVDIIFLSTKETGTSHGTGVALAEVQCLKHTLRVSITVDWFVQYALSRIGQWLMRVVQGAGAMNTAYWIPVCCVVTLGPSGMIY